MLYAKQLHFMGRQALVLENAGGLFGDGTVVEIGDMGGPFVPLKYQWSVSKTSNVENAYHPTHGGALPRIRK